MLITTKKVQVTAMIEMETYQRLADLSRQTGKSKSALIREAIEAYIRGCEKGVKP